MKAVLLFAALIPLEAPKPERVPALKITVIVHEVCQATKTAEVSRKAVSEHSFLVTEGRWNGVVFTQKLRPYRSKRGDHFITIDSARIRFDARSARVDSFQGNSEKLKVVECQVIAGPISDGQIRGVAIGWDWTSGEELPQIDQKIFSEESHTYHYTVELHQSVADGDVASFGSVDEPKCYVPKVSLALAQILQFNRDGSSDYVPPYFREVSFEDRLGAAWKVNPLSLREPVEAARPEPPIEWP
ncbi:hypothetical protein [Stratiformator vulcanicus]|uniref:Uncharacterized protein n=1 Tax=Stratiformator vulcanicus TaxID=2527980 RepID=A0A517R4M5_9PLAN|nr:hypothetical protein [Stratiformator vulcanicus]QDT38839.1 hypothetical protein Pan189_32380 [Stratiformator vulcanicus]